MKEIVLKGHGTKGVAEGEALVIKDALSFMSGVNLATGVILEKKLESRGQDVGGKILVFPSGKGTTTDPYALYLLMRGGKAPRAIINVEANPVTAAGAIMCRLPIMHRLNRNPLEVIETGDFVRVDGEKGTVTVTKKSG
ncbi:MAG: DUF126 domain-containing protein [Chloroflexota bacterium]